MSCCIFQVLVKNAVIGLGIGLSIALPILVIATNNLVTGLIATFTLVCITVTVSGLIDAAGWKLGVRMQNLEFC